MSKGGAKTSRKLLFAGPQFGAAETGAWRGFASKPAPFLIAPPALRPLSAKSKMRPFKKGVLWAKVASWGFRSSSALRRSWIPAQGGNDGENVIPRTLFRHSPLDGESTRLKGGLYGRWNVRKVRKQISAPDGRSVELFLVGGLCVGGLRLDEKTEKKDAD